MKEARNRFLLLVAITSRLFADDLAQMQQRLDALEAHLKAAPGYALNTQVHQPGLLHVVSVLLPPQEVRKIFGNDIGNNLAVVRITLSNASREAAFVVKSPSIDYGDWFLSNCDTPKIGQKLPFSLTGTDQKGLDLKDIEAFSYPCRVASMEVREVRQIARLGQTNSWRNKTDRSFRGAGVAGGALTGVFRHGLVFPRILVAYNSGAVPVFEDIFKDAAEDQINLLNDLAFRINVLVPKESAITVTGFFPMNRFLSSYLIEIFKKELALFFSPGQYLLRPSGKSKSKIDFDEFFNNVLDRMTDIRPLCKDKDGASGGPCLTNDDRLNLIKNPQLVQLLDRVSLNHIYVVASGEFVANADAAAPQISDVALDKPLTDVATFGQAGTIAGTISGTGLKDATPKILNGAAIGATIERVAEGSDDTRLKFKLIFDRALGKDVPLQFAAAKTAGGREWTSNTREVSLTYNLPKPTINSTALTGKAGDTLTITGTGFYDVPNSKLQARFTVDGSGQPSDAAEITRTSATEVKVVIPSKTKPGKQKMQVLNGLAQPSKSVEVTVTK